MRLNSIIVALFTVLSAMALAGCGVPSSTPIVSRDSIVPTSQTESTQTSKTTQPFEPTRTAPSVNTFSRTLAPSPTLPTIISPDESSATPVTRLAPVPITIPTPVANIPGQKPVIGPSPVPSRLDMMWNQRVEEAFAPLDCPVAIKLEPGDSDYKGLLVDTHFHMPHLWDAPLESDGDGGSYERDVRLGNFPRDEPILGKNITMSEIACGLGQEGIVSAYAFFFVESEKPGQLRPSLDVVRRTMNLYPDRFVPFIQPVCCNETAPTVDASTLSEFLEIHPGLFRGLGEIVLYDQPREGGGRKAEDYPPDAPLLLEVYQVARQHKLLVWLHPGEGHQDSLERVLNQHPGLNFIVHGEETEGNIGNLMEKYSNIYFSLNDLHGKEYPLGDRNNKSRFLAILGDYEPLIKKDLATWQELIEKYPDRFMWATDRGGSAGFWSYDADVGQILVNYARAFIGRLDPAVQERFAYKNAQRLIQK